MSKFPHFYGDPETFNSWYVGWANYHKMTNYPAQFKTIEAHTRRRLRARIVSQKKKRRNLAVYLIKRGIGKGRAYGTAYSHRRKWAMSKTKAMEDAHSNKWFEEQGLVEFSKKKLAHWLDIKEWVKLT